MSNFPISDQKLEELRTATRNDMQMNQLKKFILSGWPERRSECPDAVAGFWNYRDEMSIYEDIIMKGGRLVIPKSLREEMVNRVHMGHMGMEKCKRHARDVLFWPRMNDQIERAVAKCQVCQEHQMANRKERLISHEVFALPWQMVATDLFVLEDMNFVPVVNYFSRYFEIERRQNTKASTVTQKTKAIFARHGAPQLVVSDNGPQYSSQDFEQFSHE